MKIKASVIATRGGFADHVKEMVKANKEGFEAGWFAEQGEHTTAHMTYPELGWYHATGGHGTGKVVQRDILAVTEAVYPPHKEKEILDLIGQWVQDPNPHNTSKMLDQLGGHTVERIKSIFGSEGLKPSTFNPEPLVDTGEWRDNTAHRTTKDKVIKKGV